MNDLLVRYLADLDQRKKVDEFGDPLVSVTLRKGVMLDEIETRIDEVAKKAAELALDAD